MIVFLLIFALLVTPAWAGEKEEAQLKIQVLQERVWRLDAQWQLMQRVLPEALAELEKAKKILAEIEKKQTGPKKDGH